MAQTMQAFIANMLEMRKQEADAARFRAAMQQKQQEEWADFAAQMGQGITSALTKNAPSARDKLANQMMQAEYTIPGAQRAQAVNPAMQGPADAIASNMYKGGMAEFEMRQKMEDQTAQRLVEGSQIDARTAKLSAAEAAAYYREEANKRAEAAVARQAELDAIKAEQALVDRARKDYSLTSKRFQELSANAKGYTSQLNVALKALGHAKTPEEHQAAVDTINANYQAGIGSGLKVAEPVIRPFISEEQRAAIASEEQRLRAMPRHSGVLEDQTPDWLQWPRPQQERSAIAAEEKLKGMTGYAQTRPDYVPPEQPKGIYPEIGPAPEVPAILGGTGSNSTPAQAVGGTASGSAAPQPISADEAFKMTGKQFPPGKRFDSGPNTQVYVVK